MGSELLEAFGAEPGAEGGEDDTDLDTVKADAAAEVRSAVEAKDDAALASALQMFIEACGYAPPMNELE